MILLEKEEKGEKIFPPSFLIKMLSLQKLKISLIKFFLSLCNSWLFLPHSLSNQKNLSRIDLKTRLENLVQGWYGDLLAWPLNRLTAC